jgi:hypothetical protein
MRAKHSVGLLLLAGILAACGPKPPPCTGDACPAASDSGSQAGGSY